jgi:fatty-acyl-CoA synthase
VTADSIVAGPPLAGEPGLGPLTLPGFLREVTTRYADREALVFRTADGVTRWSYPQLWDRAVEVARALRALGVGKDGRVGVLMTNRPEWLAAVFGTALAGGVAVALSTFATTDELDHLLGDSAVSVLLLERSVARRDFAAALAELAPGPLPSARHPYLRHVAVLGTPLAGMDRWDEFLARGAGAPVSHVDATAAAVRPGDSALLLYSSGSTSRPKGILHGHRGVCVQLWRFRRMYGFGPGDPVRCWSANGFFWSGNLGMAIGATLAAGGSLVLQRMFDAPAALELMQAERVSFPVAWPHQWAQLAAAPNWSTVDLSALRFVDRGTALARHPTVRCDYGEPGHAYGNTETFTISTCYPAGTPEEVAAGSSGVPLPGVTVKVVDPLTGTVLPRGQAGEICVRTATLMLGYLGTPLSDTLDPDGYLHTGDGGHLDPDGRLYWQGRLTDIIKTGGANVSPREVDEALAALPGVRVAQTVGVPHDTLGEIVVACVVPHDGADLDPDRIRAHLAQRLAAHKVPRRVLFFAADEVVLTGTNKIKSAELRELATRRLR